MISRYFYTIRYLKLKQIYFRVFFHLFVPKISENFKINLRVYKNKFCLPVQKKTSLLNEETFYFLNKSMRLSEIGWNGHVNTVSKLWRYNQHYFNDLNSTGSLKRKVWHDKLLKRWINENKLGKGVGWESYPTSLRIVNWIKWHLLGNTLSDSCLKSLVLQAQWLSKRIEWHILGNHLFSNAKALVFAGLFYSTKQSEIWLKKGLKIINDEINNQVLNDGGNFERSPMYHAIFLEDVLDLINISQVYPNMFQESKVNEWKKISLTMLKWLETMVHPDGQISFFNDAAIGIAPTFNELKKYAEQLGINYEFIRFKKVTSLPESGYIRLNSNNAVILLDVAPIGPDYQPGHAHADTLSFEFSLFNQRLLVNSGTSEYGTSSVRQYERSTKSHNTVVVNDKNSSEVWGGFRVAKRAYPFDLKIKESENFANISCSHDGYKRFRGKPIHIRNWHFFHSSIIINDHIDGFFKSANAYFHFHPSINIINKKKGILNLEMPNRKQAVLKIKMGEPFIEKSYYAYEFGKRLKRQYLKVVLNKKKGSSVEISW